MQRGAVIGLGMIGRHHARLLQDSERVEFAGAVDPGGDRFRAVHQPELVLDSVAALARPGPARVRDRGRPHRAASAGRAELAAAGVSMLIEKPLAATRRPPRRSSTSVADRASWRRSATSSASIPALQDLRRRLLEGQIGRLFTVSTIRSGPFPARIQDVGVVKDLATHDIDLVSWLSDSKIADARGPDAASQRPRARGSRARIGALESGAAFSIVVDWVSPTKVRRTRVLGERGMLEADTLTGDLFFYENAQVRIAWSATQQFRGVSEGNVTRYALSAGSRCSSSTTHSSTCSKGVATRRGDARAGSGDRQGGRGSAGERTQRRPRSRSRAPPRRPADARGRRGAREDRAPARRSHRPRRPRGRRLRRRSSRRRARQRRARAVPGRSGLEGTRSQSSSGGPAAGDADTTAAVAAGRGPGRRGPAADRRRARAPRLSRARRRPRRHRAGLQPGRSSASRPRSRWGRRAAGRHPARRALRAAFRDGLLHRAQPRARVLGADLPRPRDLPEARRWPERRRASAARSSSTGRSSASRSGAWAPPRRPS
jgi:UDP-N-acetylglucosamine 3-dehydrogenase